MLLMIQAIWILLVFTWEIKKETFEKKSCKYVSIGYMLTFGQQVSHRGLSLVAQFVGKFHHSKFISKACIYRYPLIELEDQ